MYLKLPACLPACLFVPSLAKAPWRMNPARRNLPCIMPVLSELVAGVLECCAVASVGLMAPVLCLQCVSADVLAGLDGQQPLVQRMILLQPS